MKKIVIITLLLFAFCASNFNSNYNFENNKNASVVNTVTDIPYSSDVLVGNC